MLFEGRRPLCAVERDVPRARPGELLLRVQACGICRTDPQPIDGEVEIGDPSQILGHQIVGTSEPGGQRFGVPWLCWTCGECAPCRRGRENLCEHARFTGCGVEGGLAEYAVADERFCFPLPGDQPPERFAPLLCAGLIGYRALGMCGAAQRLGIYGFGAAAHILARSPARTEFLALAPRVPSRTHVTTYPLERANEALGDLREGRLGGAGAVVP